MGLSLYSMGKAASTMLTSMLWICHLLNSVFSENSIIVHKLNDFYWRLASLFYGYASREVCFNRADTTCVSHFCSLWNVVHSWGQQFHNGWQVCKLAERFVPDGLCGWSFAQSGLQKKDTNGKTIPHSWFTAQLLFKQQHVLEIVENSMKVDFCDHKQWSKGKTNIRDNVLFNFSFFVHPHFADAAYGKPISPPSQMQIMALVPPFDVILFHWIRQCTEMEVHKNIQLFH